MGVNEGNYPNFTPMDAVSVKFLWGETLKRNKRLPLIFELN